MKKIFSLILLFAPLSTYAQTLTNLMPDSFLLRSVNGPIVQNFIVGNQSNKNPTWNIAQWGNPIPLESFYEISYSGNNWDISNASTAISHTDGVFQLAQNGAASGLKCNEEYDLFIETNDVITTQPYGFVTKNLGTMKSLFLNAGVKRTYEQIEYTKCPINFGSQVFSFMFQNTQTNAILYYQVILHDSRDINENWTVCPSYDGTQPHFCYSDNIRNFSQPSLADINSKITYNLDILPRLKQFFASNPRQANNGAFLDTNLSNWNAISVYIGNIVAGDAIITTQWDNVSVTSD